VTLIVLKVKVDRNPKSLNAWVCIAVQFPVSLGGMGLGLNVGPIPSLTTITARLKMLLMRAWNIEKCREGLKVKF